MTDNSKLESARWQIDHARWEEDRAISETRLLTVTIAALLLALLCGVFIWVLR